MTLIAGRRNRMPDPVAARFGGLLGALESARGALAIAQRGSDLLPDQDRKLLQQADEQLHAVELRAIANLWPSKRDR